MWSCEINRGLSEAGFSSCRAQGWSGRFRVPIAAVVMTCVVPAFEVLKAMSRHKCGVCGYWWGVDVSGFRLDSTGRVIVGFATVHITLPRVRSCLAFG